ncbi:MAG: hypothetical protein IANPNBLG_04293 [Bryobacteraceae bacterium]|nr:hypothetical protein [Bryobacteraceae bacterium]MCC6342201.1 hypothetical protein [Bryobacterales bacterium]
MDLFKAIRELYEEKQRIDEVIAHLEFLSANRTVPGRLADAGPPPASRRGRKSMGAEERLEVSRRMKDYWARRRKAPKAKAHSA